VSWESLEKIAKGGVVRGLNGARRLPLRKGWWSVRPPHAGCPQLSACCYLDRGRILRYLAVTLQDMDVILIPSVPVLSAVEGLSGYFRTPPLHDNYAHLSKSG
jgi:hypothetical protein